MTSQGQVLTYADLFRPQTKGSALTYDFGLVLGGSLLIALLAQIAIPLPGTPVPVTGQTLGVLLVGVLLGSRKGALSVLAYLAEGSLGLPFFAGGKAGAGLLIGATGGYLMGFALAAFAVGLLAERGWDRKVPTAVAAMVIGMLVIYTCGMVWLSTFVGFSKAFAAGVLPFLPGTALKIAIAAAVLPTAWRFLGKRTQS